MKRFAAVECDSAGRVTSFEEKPAAPRTLQAGTMLYHLSAETLPLVDSFLATGACPDRAGDLFAWLGGQVDTYAHPIAGQWIDIGSPEALERARRSDSRWDPSV